MLILFLILLRSVERADLPSPRRDVRGKECVGENKKHGKPRASPTGSCWIPCPWLQGFSVTYAAMSIREKHMWHSTICVQRHASGSDGQRKWFLVYQAKPRENRSCLALYSENICFSFSPRAQHLPSLLMSAWLWALIKCTWGKEAASRPEHWAEG